MIAWDEWTTTYHRLLDRIEPEAADTTEDQRNARKKFIELLTKETEQIHRDVRSILNEFSTCEHRGEQQAAFICEL